MTKKKLGRPVKYKIDEHTPTYIPCKFCKFPAKNYKALVAHLRFCKKRWRSVIIRFVDGDLWLKGNRIVIDIIQACVFDEEEPFDKVCPTLESKKSFFRAISILGKNYGKNIITKTEWGAVNSFDELATGETEIYEV